MTRHEKIKSMNKQEMINFFMDHAQEGLITGIVEYVCKHHCDCRDVTGRCITDECTKSMSACVGIWLDMEV